MSSNISRCIMVVGESEVGISEDLYREYHGKYDREPCGNIRGASWEYLMGKKKREYPISVRIDHI